MKKVFFPIFLAVCLLLQGEDQLLKNDDISKIMKQIFQQHVEKKDISSKILHDSLKIYIDQFDPEKIFLLESEVAPFLNASESTMNEWVSQYRRNEFTTYRKLNDLIQVAILRARTLRMEIEQNPHILVEEAKKIMVKEDHFYTQRPLARNTTELKARLKEQAGRFLSAEIEHIGLAQAASKEQLMIKLFEKHVRAMENRYLFTNEKGDLLAVSDRENAFVVLVLKSLASSMDAHTAFMSPSEANDMKVRLEKAFHGIGLIAQETVDGVAVMRITPNSPAAKNGLIKVGDLIVLIDGKSVEENSFEEVMAKLQGSPNTSITLTLEREGKPFTVKLMREALVVQERRVIVSHEMVEGGIIGKITLYAFYQGKDNVTSEQDIRKAIEELKLKGNLRGLILDMRENGGGYLIQAVKVAGLFITNGVVVVSKYSSGEEHFYRDIDGKMAFDGPLVILTSSITASAAEIVAQSLQDYGVALIVGDARTYGKGSIQSQTATNEKGNGASLKVTIGKYYTPSGRTPQIHGVEADIVVAGEFTFENLGEKYLEHTLGNDNIKSSLKDNIADVPKDQRDWYTKYYLPSLQRQSVDLRQWIEILSRNSAARLAKDANYQRFMQGKNGRSLTKDYQMEEGVQVIRDIIHLQTSAGGK